MPKKTVIFSIIYVIFVVWAFFYVKGILKTESLFPKDNTKPKIEKTWTVNATINVLTGFQALTYNADAKNTDTVLSFLEDLRNKKGLIFEKIDYTHGVEIGTLFGATAPAGYKWAVFLNGNDITNDIASTRLVDGAAYELKLAKK